MGKSNQCNPVQFSFYATSSNEKYIWSPSYGDRIEALQTTQLWQKDSNWVVYKKTGIADLFILTIFKIMSLILVFLPFLDSSSTGSTPLEVNGSPGPRGDLQRGRGKMRISLLISDSWRAAWPNESYNDSSHVALTTHGSTRTTLTQASDLKEEVLVASYVCKKNYQLQKWKLFYQEVGSHRLSPLLLVRDFWKPSQNRVS